MLVNVSVHLHISVCVRECTCVLVHALCASGQIKCRASVLSGLRNALHTTDDMKWPLRGTGTNPTLMFLFLIKHTLLFVWVLSQRINAKGLSRVCHRSRVKLAIKGSRSPTVAGLDESKRTAAQIHYDLNKSYSVRCSTEAILNLDRHKIRL